MSIYILFLSIPYRPKDTDDDDDDNLSVADPIDRNVENYPGYHGPITKRKATSRLRDERQNCHLIRYNMKKQIYILSVWWEEKVQHFTLQTSITHPCNKYEILGSSFDNYCQLLEFYRAYPLVQDGSIGGIGYALDKKKSPAPRCQKTSILKSFRSKRVMAL